MPVSGFVLMSSNKEEQLRTGKIHDLLACCRRNAIKPHGVCACSPVLGKPEAWYIVWNVVFGNEGLSMALSTFSNSYPQVVAC